jgi:hypothetical protein
MPKKQSMRGRVPRFAWRGSGQGYAPKKPPKYWRRWEGHTPRRTVDDASLTIRLPDVQWLVSQPKGARRIAPWGHHHSVVMVLGHHSEFGPMVMIHTLEDEHGDDSRTGPLGPQIAELIVEQTPGIRDRLRWWLCCPQCGVRRLEVYGMRQGESLGCRACLGLVYPSQHETPKQRCKRRADRAARRLGDDRVRRDIPPRIPRQHRRTYDRAVAEIRVWLDWRKQRRRAP